MRLAVIAAALTLGACAVAVPRPSCGCVLPPQPPLPTLSGEGEAALVVQALETGCRGQGAPDAYLTRARLEGWLEVTRGARVCTIEAEGPPARIAAIDAALLAYAAELNLAWNVRDSRGAATDGGREVRRTRGEHGQGEPEMTWRFVEAPPERAGMTGLRLEWSEPRP